MDALCLGQTQLFNQGTQRDPLRVTLYVNIGSADFFFCKLHESGLKIIFWTTCRGRQQCLGSCFGDGSNGDCRRRACKCHSWHSNRGWSLRQIAPQQRCHGQNTARTNWSLSWKSRLGQDFHVIRLESWGLRLAPCLCSGHGRTYIHRTGFNVSRYYILCIEHLVCCL